MPIQSEYNGWQSYWRYSHADHTYLATPLQGPRRILSFVAN